ncbi:MAG: hypothetical protein A2144_14425 [Chloroflexi bacterium RBG_16_50_9]|nr:MAG: hypothetical protein A2144_14425 [Chloroflexi bacterium RBG_16_50_9]
MDYNAWVALFCFIGMFVLIGMGLPIWLSMVTAALVGFWLVGGTNFTFQQFSTATYYITSSFNFAVVPLFILMSILAAECGIAEACYETFSKWLGGLRGGLLIATVLGAALFGACSGMALAAIAVFTKVALPELEKNNYDKPLSTACIAVSGTLDSLIPPSVPIVIFCILLELSIGRALVAGIVPGLVLALLLSLTIVAVGIINPKKVPKVDLHVSWKEKFWSLRLTGPVLLVIALVIGGMYLGIFAPTVGGAAGSAAILVIALVRRVKMGRIVHSFYETILINAQIYPLVIGGFLYSRFIALSGLSTSLMDVITQANLSPLLLMLVLVIFYLIIGCVLEFFSMLIITLPFVFPLLISAGFDPMAILIIILLLGAIAGLTPPIGMAVFVVAGVARIRPEEIFRGIMPFFFVCLAMLWLIVFFPQLATWLPDLFYGKFA